MALPPSLDWANSVSMMVGFSEPLGAFGSEHIGLFWHRVREEYPKVSTTLPSPESLGASVLLSAMSRGQFPMPGYLFSSYDGGHRLLVEQGLLAVSWDRDPVEPLDFHGFFAPTFRRAIGVFEEFIGEALDGVRLSVSLCQLTIRGALEFQSDGSDLASGDSLLRTSHGPDIGLPLSRPSEYSFTYYYDLESGLHLEVGGDVELVADGSAEFLLNLEFEASQRLGRVDRAQVDAWLDFAYESVSKACLNLRG